MAGFLDSYREGLDRDAVKPAFQAQLGLCSHLAALAVNRLRAVVDAVTSADPDASDKAVVQSILFEAGIVQRSLSPRFGHEMDVTSPTVAEREAP